MAWRIPLKFLSCCVTVNPKANIKWWQLSSEEIWITCLLALNKLCCQVKLVALSYLILIVFWLRFKLFIRPVWLNGWVFVYKLSGCGFESSCSYLNFRFRACFEQGVPWHSCNYRVWIHSDTRKWLDKNIESIDNLDEFLNR